MVDYKEFQQDFDKVIKYSQGFDTVNSDALLTKWAEAKEDLYHKFGDNLIYNVGHVSIHLPLAQKLDKVESFISRIYYDYRNRAHGDDYYNIDQLVQFVRENKETFFDNVVKYKWERCYSEPEEHIIINPGMKLTKAFKFFVKETTLLDEIQTDASRVIQEDRLEGDLCFSIHPLDFLSSSENGYNWRSCHALDGEYRAGNLSYMMDSCTVITYIKGKDKEKLPNFPPDVLWNSKKWRMLLFTSINHTCLFAGRQYPMDLGNSILNTILGQFVRFYGWSASQWSDWHDDRIDSYNYKDDPGYRDSGNLEKIHVIINGYIYRLNNLITDVEGSKHFNDLLHSSCYIPRYCWLKGGRFIPEFKIGGSIPCLICGERPLVYTDLMCCERCGTKNGYGDDYVVCSDCGRRIYIDDAYWVDSRGEYICYHCYDNNYMTCDDCGEIYPRDEMNEGTNGYWYCNNCSGYHTLVCDEDES